MVHFKVWRLPMFYGSCGCFKAVEWKLKLKMAALLIYGKKAASWIRYLFFGSCKLYTLSADPLQIWCIVHMIQLHSLLNNYEKPQLQMRPPSPLVFHCSKTIQATTNKSSNYVIKNINSDLFAWKMSFSR